MPSKRVVFTFDSSALDALRALQQLRQHRSLAETVRESIQILRALQQQFAEGFSQVIVRNPGSGAERFIVFTVGFQESGPTDQRAQGVLVQKQKGS